MAVHNIPIEDNRIFMQRKGSTDKKDTVEAVLLGAERVDVGVNSGEKEIAKDEISQLNYERDRIDSKTVYDLSKQKRKCFFMLDLETGRGKGCWFPGSIRIGTINKDTELKSEKSEDSQSLIPLAQDLKVKVLDVEYDTEKRIWYLLTVDNIEGYILNSDISDIKYIDPKDF